MLGLGSHESNMVGASLINTNLWPDPVKMRTPDPERVQVLLPEPPAGVVRVPLYAAIQADGPNPIKVGEGPEAVFMPVPFISCHGRLERTGNAFDPGLDVSKFLTSSPVPGSTGTCLLWSVKLTDCVLHDGEFFLPVPAFPIVRGCHLIASWSYATSQYQVRTRSVWVDQPLATFDWSRVQPLQGQFRQTTV